MEMYAERKGWDLGQTEVAVEIGYEGPVPTSFDVTVSLPPELDAEQRRRLLVIATKCPIHKVLAGEARVTVTERLESI
jgi:putative redox protein